MSLKPFFFVFLVLISLAPVYSADYVQKHNVSINLSVTDTNLRSQAILIKDSDYTLTEVLKSNISDGTYFKIYNLTNYTATQELYSCEFVGDVCSTDFVLKADTYYIFSVNKGVSISHTQAYGRSVSNPVLIEDSKVWWLNATYWDGSKWNKDFGNYIMNIERFNVSDTTTSLQINTNLVNNTINYNDNNISISYNGTLTYSTTNIYNCSLYDNTTLLNYSENVDLSINNYWFLDLTEIEQTYNFKINCSNSEATDTTLFYVYKVDTINPIILSDYVNNTIYVEGSSLIFNANFTDKNLFVYNISIINDNNEVLLNKFAENLTTGFEKNSTSYILSEIVNGTIKLQVWDSHTKPANITSLNFENIGDDVISVDYGGLNFTGVKLYNNKNETISYFYLAEDLSKYKLKLSFEETDIYHTFYIYGNDLIPVYNSGYKGHFVYKYLYWIDTEGLNIKNVFVAPVLNGFKVDVELYNPSDEIELESIGSLNYAEKVYRYSVLSDLYEQTGYLKSIDQTLIDIKGGVIMIGYIMLLLFAFGIYIFNSNIVVDFLGAVIYLSLIYGFSILGDFGFLVYLCIGGVILTTIKVINHEETNIYI